MTQLAYGALLSWLVGSGFGLWLLGSVMYQQDLKLESESACTPAALLLQASASA